MFVIESITKTQSEQKRLIITDDHPSGFSDHLSFLFTEVNYSPFLGGAGTGTGAPRPQEDSRPSCVIPALM